MVRVGPPLAVSPFPKGKGVGGFGLVLLLAAVLRLAWLGTIPAGLSHDEAVKAYDAWSVLHTGRDQYGHLLPLVFRAIGDQREALMPYLIAASEAVLGPTDFAVRLPAALAGIALVAVLFLLGRELFDARAGLLAAALLACSPWHVQVSRLAFRAGLLPFTTAVGLWLFLLALRRPPLMLTAGAVLGLGLHTYLAARLFLPLLLLGLVVVERDTLVRARCPGRGLRSLWSRPVVPLLAGVSIMALPLAVWSVQHPREFIGHAAESAGSGPPLHQAVDAAGRYVVYFGPRHLLTQGDPYPVPSTGRFGALYWPALPLFLAGLVVLLRRRRREDLLVLWWLAIYPLPAALTRGAHPDWLRASAGIGAIELTTAVGGVALLGLLGHARYRRPLVALVALLFALNVGWFIYDYTLRFPLRAAHAFTDGFAPAVQRLVALDVGYSRIVLPAEVPAVHDLFLWYTRYAPRRLQAEGLEDVAAPGAWADVRGFGRQRVCRPRDCCGEADLCLVRGEWSGPGTVLAVIHDRAGRVAFSIVGPNPP